MKKIFKFVSEVVIVIIVAIAFVFILNASLLKSEAFQCNKWNDEATKYNDYYVTSLQVAQCDAHSITLIAPVK